jgi:threonylcarbamoyladenosine tRNA methylthiotransferase MtaB
METATEWVRNWVDGGSRKVCIAFAKGCPRNEMDTAWLCSYFQANGWEVTNRAREAEAVVVATCAFDGDNERHSLRLLGLIHGKMKPGARLIVVGCLAGIIPDRVRRQFDALVIAPIEIHKLDEVIGARVKLCDTPPVNDAADLINYAKKCWTAIERCPTARHLAETAMRKIDGLRRNPSSRRLFRIRVARGCDEQCSYCAIRFVVGRFRSKPLKDVLAEFDSGLQQGYDRFELLADDVGPYGTDLGTDILQLLREIFRRPSPFKLILTDVHPQYLIRYQSDLIELLAANSEKIEVVRVPVQSGSDRILGLMRRPYASADVAAAVDELCRQGPTVKLETHILVGFPGETDADFEETVGFLRCVHFDWIRVYRYTDRPNTLATEMSDKVPEDVIRRRAKRLNAEFRSVAV